MGAGRVVAGRALGTGRGPPPGIQSRVLYGGTHGPTTRPVTGSAPRFGGPNAMDSGVRGRRRQPPNDRCRAPRSDTTPATREVTRPAWWCHLRPAVRVWLRAQRSEHGAVGGAVGHTPGGGRHKKPGESPAQRRVSDTPSRPTPGSSVPCWSLSAATNSQLSRLSRVREVATTGLAASATACWVRCLRGGSRTAAQTAAAVMGNTFDNTCVIRAYVRHWR